jgi:iron complex outermembrane receptor protein
MYVNNKFRRVLTVSSLACALGAGGFITAHAADEPDDQTDETDQAHGRSLDPVLVTAQALKGPQESPSQGSLVATQPQSVVGGEFIRNNDSPAANYTDIMKLTPSVWTVDPNGAGLMENAATSIRGFQDGQFNVTFDGIPWGDSNDFTHHSTSYFVAQDIGNVVVDRGPGNAATVGDATFGGTVYVQSDDPKKVSQITTNLTLGSFNTQVAGVRYDTGEMSQYGGTRAFVSIKTISSDGYLSNANIERSNVFFKSVTPLNDSTDLTFASNLNKLRQNPPIGATQAQIAAYGPNYSYNTNTDSQAYYGYNQDKITTDYEYIGITSRLDGWTFDNKLYTYAYLHDELSGADPNGQGLMGGPVPAGDTPNVTYNPNGTTNPGNVPGNVLTNNYRSIGDIFRVSRDLGPGDLQFGGWFDHQTNLRRLYDADFSNNGAFNYDISVPAGGLAAAAYTDRLMQDQLFTRQAYLQYVWNVVSGLDVTGGMKHVSFERDLAAPVNQGTQLPIDYSTTWTRNLPSLDVHYKLADNWSAYAQYAQGFLAPNLNTLYVANPALNTVDPESTTNVQVGTTWVGRSLTVSADVYTINFSNEIGHRGIDVDGVSYTQFYNLGGVKYKGVEAEGTYVVGAGLSLYANASYNSARLDNDTTTDNTWVPATPDKTGVIGVLYHQGPIQGSLIEKYIGRRYGDADDAYPLGGYGTADAAINYLFGPSDTALKNAKIGVTVQNITDRKSIYYLSTYTGGGVPLWFTIPGIGFQVNLSASF